ncbi:hypothetical protein J6590_075665 [Homalodisca vitripennis]|nr:hypothetical protein J6590_075665 [Homalodisca vitripennis]
MRKKTNTVHTSIIISNVPPYRETRATRINSWRRRDAHADCTGLTGLYRSYAGRSVITPLLARLYPLIFAAHCCSSRSLLSPSSSPSTLLSWLDRVHHYYCYYVRPGPAASMRRCAARPARLALHATSSQPVFVPPRPEITCHIYIVISIRESECTYLTRPLCLDPPASRDDLPGKVSVILLRFSRALNISSRQRCFLNKAIAGSELITL